MRIRRLKNTLEDIKILKNFDRKLSIYEGDLDITMKYPLKVDYGNDLKNEQHYIVVLEEADVPIGYGVAKIEKMTKASGSQKYGLIETLFLEEKYRQKSFGKMIFDELKKWLEKKEIRIIRLKSFANNCTNEVYKKWGFKPYLVEFILEK